MEPQLRQQILTALLTAPDEQARARVLYDIVRAAYDTVKSVHSGAGLYDTAERQGIGQVSDAAQHHMTAMAAHDHRADDRAIVQHLQDTLDEDPREAFHREVTAPMSDDDHPIALSAYQAEKCGAIVKALADGETEWTQAAQQVSFLLSVRSLTAKGIPHQARDPWPTLAELPWPLPPGLRDHQAD